MKIILLCAAASTLNLYAEPELERVQKAYNKAISRLNAQYVTALERVKTNYTKAGNLDGALKIREEIERLTPKPQEKPEELRADFSGTKWQWNEKYVLNLHSKGSATLTEKGVKLHTWSWEHKNRVIKVTTHWAPEGIKLKLQDNKTAVIEGRSTEHGKTIKLIPKIRTHESE